MDDKVSLEWGKFSRQFLICFMALLGAIFASHKIFGPQENLHAIANTTFGPVIGAILIMGTFILALWALRVPYRTDMFERRLRNWSMTSAAIIVFTLSVVVNIGFHQTHNGDFIITPYVMPALWLLCYIIYSQYTRYCVAHGRKNSFIDGSGC